MPFASPHPRDPDPGILVPGGVSRPISRRAAFRLGAGAALAGVAPFARAEDASGRAAEAAHEEIWRRFVDRRFDVLLHYAGLGGEVILPTPEECEACKPNGMSWSLPIEDGPFFGGLYLDGLCRRHAARRDAEAADKARRIASGLMRLAAAGCTPGFIARGLGADGRSHYPASSEDQTFPWFFGLWRYARSGIPDEGERRAIVAQMAAVARALEGHGWQIPCDREGFGYRGGFHRPTARDGARLLCVLRALHELDKDARWLREYRRLLFERVGKSSRTREALCADGFDFGSGVADQSHVWTTSMCQAALRGLVEMETDTGSRAQFQRGLGASAHKAAEHLARGDRYDRATALRFDPDWRFLNEAWKPQRTCDEAIALARSQLPLWAAHSPRGPWEDDSVREPLFAAWVIALSGNPEVIGRYRDRIMALLSRYDWRRLYTSTFFIAVNLHYELVTRKP